MNKAKKCPVCGSEKLEEIYATKSHPFFEGVKKRPYKEIRFFPLSINSCKNCEFIFKTITKEVENALDKFYKSEVSMSSAPIDKSRFSLKIANMFINNIVEFFDGAKVKRVLEIGCREGYILAQIRKRFGAEVIGIDVSSVKPYEDEFGPLNIVHSYFPSKKITGTFDLIYAKALLEHIRNLDGFIKSIRKQTEQDGIFVCQVPRVEEGLKDGNIGPFIHEHVNFFTENSLRFLFENNGFAIEKIIKNHASITIFCRKGKGRISNIKLEGDGFVKFAVTIERFKKLLKENKMGFYGASAELFNYLYTVIGSKETKFNIYDSDFFKVGKFFGRNKLPIKSADEISNNKILIMPYNYADEIKNNLTKIGIKAELINFWDI